MGRDREIEKKFIRKLASVVQDKDFIVSSLRLMDNDTKRNEVISYINKHPNTSKKEIEAKMFYITISN